MRIDRHCQWVRHRLPLLVGGELPTDERRRVERHLIGCIDCRESRESSTGAFSALRSFAEVSPARVDAPSLWPALADQIRRSRHASPAPSWWATPWPRAWVALGLTMSLMALAIAPLVLLSGHSEPVPSSSIVSVKSVKSRPVETPKLVVRPPSTSPKKLVSPGFDPTSNTTVQLNYDLDHGTPVGPGDRDPQHSY